MANISGGIYPTMITPYKNGEITKYTVDNDTMNSVQGCLSA